MAATGEGGDRVVLLHGIINRPFMMSRIEKELQSNGFDVHNWGYDSTRGSIEDHARDLRVFIAGLDGRGPVHIVGFSLGAVVARHCLATAPPEQSGRFVQIAPPNRGSALVNRHEGWPPFGWIFGREAIDQLRDGSPFLDSLGIPAGDWGIVVGGTGDEKGYSDALPGDDDGTVSLSSSLVAGHDDWVQVPSRHTALLFKKRTAKEIVHFLNHGRFQNSAIHKETP